MRSWVSKGAGFEIVRQVRVDYCRLGGGTFTAILAVLLVVAGLGLAMAAPAGAQVDSSAAARCSGHHGFGAEPVDVAKTADNSVVLAKARWGYSAQHGICYLVLDDAAVQVLRDNADRMPDPMLGPDPSAAARCSGHHGFGAEPVDVAKTADNSVVLAKAYWGYSAQHGICYLVLDDAALSVLRDSPVAAFSDGVLPPTAELSSTSSQVSEDPGRQAIRHVRVDYCGPSTGSSAYSASDLRSEVRELQTHVDGFIERQSGYDEDAGNIRRTRLVFETGYLLHPVVDWDSQSIAVWYNEYIDAHDSSREYSDPCRKEAAARSQENEDIYPDVLILADVDATDIVGYARQGRGPALVAARNQHPGGEADYLETVAHEIGHAFYDLSHPWADLFGHSDPNDLSPSEVQKYLHEHVDEAQSLMSYYYIQGESTGKRRDIRASAPNDDRAYIACYQRRAAGWTVGSGCEFPVLTPETPDPPTVVPGDRQITVYWKAPNERGAAITEYHLQYQRETSTNWIDVDWEWESGTPLQTTIGGLDNGTTYFVRIQAENRVGKSAFFSAAASGTPQIGRPPTVTLTVGTSAQGARGADGTCSSVHCRWLNVEIENFGPGPHTLACAHRGIESAGIPGGVYHSDVVSEWPANRSCLFGYPGSEVFVIVGAERRGGLWHGGVYSNVITWPHGGGTDNQGTDGEPTVRLTKGRNAQGVHSGCTSANCHFMRVEIVDFAPGTYNVLCAHHGVPSHSYSPGVWERYSTSEKVSEYCIWGFTDRVYVIVENPTTGVRVRSNDAQWP